MQAEVKGTTLPVLEVSLEPGESVVSDHGELAWMSPTIQMTQKTSTGGKGGLMAGLKRVAGGASIFLTEYLAAAGPGRVTFATHLPGAILPVDIEAGKNMIVHRSGWVCGTPGISPTVALQQSMGGAIFGGEGFILQRLEGSGRAWIELSGEVTDYQLEAGEVLLAHPGHIGMFDQSVQFSITTVPGIKNKIFGGDGIFLVRLSGPGHVWLQSLTLPGLAASLAPYLPDNSNSSSGGRGLGGIMGNILNQ
ncbi:MAG TPA: TIGR00266 family protein [Acidimicrobiales bacterium]|nr:TIGR00266 family protein [Acidimicrobiales bacterium]